MGLAVSGGQMNAQIRVLQNTVTRVLSLPPLAFVLPTIIFSAHQTFKMFTPTVIRGDALSKVPKNPSLQRASPQISRPITLQRFMKSSRDEGDQASVRNQQQWDIFSTDVPILQDFSVATRDSLGTLTAYHHR